MYIQHLACKHLAFKALVYILLASDEKHRGKKLLHKENSLLWHPPFIILHIMCENRLMTHETQWKTCPLTYKDIRARRLLRGFSYSCKEWTTAILARSSCTTRPLSTLGQPVLFNYSFITICNDLLTQHYFCWYDTCWWLKRTKHLLNNICHYEGI